MGIFSLLPEGAVVMSQLDDILHQDIQELRQDMRHLRNDLHRLDRTIASWKKAAAAVGAMFGALAAVLVSLLKWVVD